MTTLALIVLAGLLIWAAAIGGFVWLCRRTNYLR